MKRFCLVLVTLLISFFEMSAQTWREWTLDEALAYKGGTMFSLYEGVYRDPYPTYGRWHSNNTKRLDRSYLRIDYDADILLDSLSGKRGMDRVRTLLGKNYMLSNGHCYWMGSMCNSVPEDQSRNYERPTGYYELINWFVYRNLTSRTVLNLHSLPMLADYAIQYDEPQPSFVWTMSADTMTVSGYLCQRADTDYRGRHWTVWFTPEIPVDCGFWKFSGLPGLILKAEDSERYYSFTAVSIKNAKEDIDVITSIAVKKLPRDKFRSVEKSRFDNPIQNSWHKNGYMIGTHLGMKGIDESLYHTVFTSENYTSPHYPMERK